MIIGGYNGRCGMCCARIIKAQLTVTPSGTRLIHWIDWSELLHDFFKTISNLTIYHHFKFSKTEPGVVVLNEYANSPEKSRYFQGGYR